MLSPTERDEALRVTWPLKVIVPILALGVLLFLGIAAQFGGGDETPPGDDPVRAYLAPVALVLAGVCVVLAVLVPGLISSSRSRALVRRRAPTADVGGGTPWGMLYFQQALLGAAILEGAAFFNAVVFLLDRSVLHATVAGILALGILLRIPPDDGVATWIDRRIELARGMR